MKSTSLKTFVAATLVAGALAACGDDPFQVIEELEFAQSLGIDLTQMEMLNSGVYLRDITVGTGDEARVDSVLTVTYIGYLADGTEFGSGTFPFTLGVGDVVEGFDEGVFGMREGGQRLIVIPPERGYGNTPRAGIPAGSVLVFDVTVDQVGEDPVVVPGD